MQERPGVLAVTLFAIGYEPGKDMHDHHDQTQKQPLQSF